ncbi:phosphopantetheine-binding protein [Streptomyces lasalocidi]|uniref:Acyl carrier protein n=1 Tax=Streptomyces lasalocidi TaxID=324833 RepID=A0A4U5W4I6_STRLS|nr:phosphopantetheine-binding protein [Streptomyces lasalocidi]TKS96364.1 acyl carrier protein [Streptomyces lasalocidi]
MEITDRVTVLLHKHFGVRLDESFDVPLHQLAIDSLAAEELLRMVEDECAIDMTDVTLTSKDTIGSLMEMVRQKAAVA